MIANTLLRELTGEALEINVTEPLSSLITAINRYAVLPVYTLHFLVSKINLAPFLVLVAYDDNPFMVSATATNTRLQDIMADSLPGTACPSVIIIPEDLNFEDVIYNTSDKYYYSTAYVLAGKEIKKLLTSGLISKLALYTNTGRDYVSCKLICDKIEDTCLISQLPEQVITPIKLPFLNYVRQNPRYKPIMDSVITGGARNIDDQPYLKKFFEDLKKKQAIDIDGVKVFRDFVKLKPSTMKVFSAKEPFDNGVNAISVCVLMTYSGTKTGHAVFYKYLDGIVDSVLGEGAENEDDIIPVVEDEE